MITAVSYPIGWESDREESVPGRSLQVSLDRQVAVFLENGVEAQAAFVSSGRPEHETPTGTFTVLYRRRAPVSSSYMVRMPYWICIDPQGQLGLHESSPEHLDKLGLPTSHGCIRLGRNTACWAYEWLVDGSKVVVR
ncbi:L,D-transpeptidase family protein [Candidatus Fermentibacteria bacterium]|nr:L,D-transpeptidase family protein [Candidatus Fermentibacteria bacterium]